MVEAQIVQHLKEKHNELVESLNSPLKELVRDYTYFAGGCIASLWHDEPPRDYDLYFTDQQSANFAYLLAFLHNWRLLNTTNNSLKHSISLTEYTLTIYTLTIYYNGNSYQLIHKFSGQPKDVVKTFDFYHTMGWFSPQQNKLHFSCNNSKWALKNKDLDYNVGSPYPASALKRIVKFARRGWHVEDYVFESILDGLAKLDLKAPDVLEAQKAGMYRVQI